MSTTDKLIHPALLDPRMWADVNLYDTTTSIDRSEIEGDEHHTPDRKFALRHLKLDLRIDDERQSVNGIATDTISPLNDGFTHF